MAFPFLRLPDKIRRQIYKYLTPEGTRLYLTSEGTVQQHCSPYVLGGNRGDELPAADIVALFSTCRTIYAEASPLLYSNNTIVSYGLGHLLQMPEQTLNSITSLEFHVSPEVDYPDTILEDSRDHTYSLTVPDSDRLVPGWRGTINLIRFHLWLDRLELRVVCDCSTAFVREVRPMNIGRILLAPLLNYRLKGCHFRFEDTMQSALLARGATQRTTARRGFRFSDLPAEIRLKILKYTDLVTPCSAVRWSPRGYSLHISKEDTKLSRLEWLSQDGSYMCEGYYVPDVPRFQCWEKPTAMFLVNKAFSSEAQAVFFACNQFEISSERDANVRKRTGDSGTVRAKQFLDKLTRATLPSLQHLDIRHEFLFFNRAPGYLRGDVCWVDTVTGRTNSINLQLLCFRVELQSLPLNIERALEPGLVSADDSMPPMSKMVNKYIWPLCTVGRRPGVGTLVIRITTPTIHGYYYLRQASVELPERFRNKSKSAQVHIARLVKVTPEDCLAGIPYSMTLGWDGLPEVQETVKYSKMYEDALVEGFWFWRCNGVQWKVNGLEESLGPNLSSVMGVFGA